MDWESWFFVFGTLYFMFSFVLLIVLILGAIWAWKNLNEMQEIIQQAMEEKKSLTTMVPMMLVALVEARSMFRRFRGPRY